MKAFTITYDGSYLGGRAVVLADTPEQAIEALRPSVIPEQFSGAEVSEEQPIDKPRVLYNWNGDY